METAPPSRAQGWHPSVEKARGWPGSHRNAQLSGREGGRRCPENMPAPGPQDRPGDPARPAESGAGPEGSPFLLEPRLGAGPGRWEGRHSPARAPACGREGAHGNAVSRCVPGRGTAVTPWAVAADQPSPPLTSPGASVEGGSLAGGHLAGLRATQARPGCHVVPVALCPASPGARPGSLSPQAPRRAGDPHWPPR